MLHEMEDLTMLSAPSRFQRMWTVTTATSFILACALTSSAMAQDSGVKRDPSPASDGPVLSVTHCEASVRVTMPQPQGPKSRYVSRNFEVYARLDVPGGSAPSWCEKFEIIELRDAAGTDLLAGMNRRREPDMMHRYNLSQQLVNQYVHGRTVNTTVTDSVRNLKELPTQLSRVKIRADLVTSRKPTMVKVPLKVMDAPTTLVPGVTILVTKIEEQKGSITAWLEVRSRTPEAKAEGQPQTNEAKTNEAKKDKADAELARPIFAGVVFRNRDGDIGGVMPIGQTIELHDESIMVAQGMPISDQHLASDGTIEVLIFDRMEHVTVETTLENVELAVGGEAAAE